MSNYIRLYDGSAYDYSETGKKTITLDMIATQLSRQPRFMGATRYFYSVAQHAVMCAMIAEGAHGPKTGLYALHHDDHEALLGDMPTPLKREIEARTGMSVVADLAHEADEAIFKALGLPKFEQDVYKDVKLIDWNMFLTEGLALIKGFKMDVEENTYAGTPYLISLSMMDEETAKREYLNMHNGLMDRAGLRRKTING